ncbi:MAG TPA: histidine kinase [Chitinophagaceae bacterium]|nr:histidine kinase [Chitinophagaceae bacterium]
MPFTLTESILLLVPQIVATYLTLYFVLPFYTKRNRILAVLFLVMAWVISSFLSMVMLKDINPAILDWILPEKYLRNTGRAPEVSSYMGLILAGKGAFTSTALALFLKFTKQWYLKEQRNIQLQKQNTEAQLQLLTAQVHPHFLFNTLNNIYSQAQNESPKSSKMIMGLSDLLRYILYEGRKPLVPLDKELQMILEYINLEKIRYGNKLDLHYLIADKTKDVYIAPLLLLPFVENCFKHGASNMLQNPWINLTIEVKETTLAMKLMNGKTENTDSSPSKPGIGISNVRQRLELLYKNKHELQIREEEDVFIVDLKVQLVRLPELQHVIDQTAPEILYA